MSSTLLQPGVLQARVRSLPALPQAVQQLRAALTREGVALDQLADTISHDQALTAKTLRLANSSFYGVPGRVGSIRDAISILGLRTLATVTTTAVVVSSFNRTDCASFDFDGFWRHSVATALCAQTLAEAVHLDPEAAFTAGLLHDIGRLALATHFPRELSEVLALAARDDMLKLDAERELLGTDHTAVGGLICEHWHFSPLVAQAIRLHHDVPLHDKPTLVDVVHLADNITHALDLAHQADDMVPPLSLDVWERLDLSATQLRDSFERTETQAHQVCEALNV